MYGWLVAYGIWILYSHMGEEEIIHALWTVEQRGLLSFLAARRAWQERGCCSGGGYSGQRTGHG